MGESGGEAAARRGDRSAQAAPATDPLRGGAAPQPPGHPGQEPHSRSAGEFWLRVRFTCIHQGAHVIIPLHLISTYSVQ